MFPVFIISYTNTVLEFFVMQCGCVVAGSIDQLELDLCKQIDEVKDERAGLVIGPLNLPAPREPLAVSFLFLRILRSLSPPLYIFPLPLCVALSFLFPCVLSSFFSFLSFCKVSFYIVGPCSFSVRRAYPRPVHPCPDGFAICNARIAKSSPTRGVIC